jgi:hypothetical protein
LRVLVIIFLFTLSLLFVSGAERRNNNVFGDGGIFTMIANFAAGLFKLLGQKAFFAVFVMILLFVLFRYLLLFAVSFFPDSISSKFGMGGTSGANSPDKAMKNLATVLALLLTFGVVGFLSYDSYSFSLDNVYQRVQIILLTLGTIGVWAFAAMFGGIAYYVTISYAKKKAEGTGSISFMERLGVFLVTFGLTSFVGNGLIDKPTMPGLFLFIIGLGLLGSGYLSSYAEKSSNLRGVKRPSTLMSPTSSGTPFDFITHLQAFQNSLHEIYRKLDLIHIKCNDLLAKRLPTAPGVIATTAEAVLNDTDLKSRYTQFANEVRNTTSIMNSIQTDSHFSEMVKPQKKVFNTYKRRLLQYENKAANMFMEFRENVITGKHTMHKL